MIPPNITGIGCSTPGGISYVVLFDEYSEHWAADANQIVANVVINWADRDDFLEEVVGWSTWDGSSTTLNRNLPLQCPLATGLWLDDALLVKKGMVPGSGTQTFDNTNNNWPQFDWAQYKLTFLRPKWWVRYDATIAISFFGKEQYRYVEFSTRYVPRERKKPRYTFEYDETAGLTGGTAWSPGNNLIPVDEVGFLPDYQIESIAKWKQVPLGAVPWTAIQAALCTVNLTNFNPGYSTQYPGSQYTYTPGQLLFRGPQNPITFYWGADGNPYVDLLYAFAAQPGGWNSYLLNQQSSGSPPTKLYAPVRARGVTPTTPPYASTEFQKLFTPAAS
jgi:hypothetical protein